MIYGGCCYSAHDGQLTTAELQALADIFPPRAPILRLGASLAKVFPAPDKEDFNALDDCAEKAVATGWQLLIDPADLPVWATGGVPVAVSSVDGSSCQILAQWGVPRAEWPAIYALDLNRPRDDAAQSLVEGALLRMDAESIRGLTNSVDKIAWHFVDQYRKEQGCSLAWPDPETFGKPHGVPHFWGTPGFEEQDKLSAPRPQLLSADTFPPADAKAVRHFAKVIANRYGDRAPLKRRASFFGIGINEPDIPNYYPLIRFDGVNGGNGGDTITRLIKERLLPYIAGLEAVLRDYEPLRTHWPLILGPNCAYPPTLLRFAALRRKLNVIGYHLYGGYDDAKRYANQFAADGYEDAQGCSEIDGPDMAGWLRGLLALRLDPAPQFVIFNRGQQFIEGFGKGGTKPTADGIETQKVFAAENSRRHAAGGK